MPVGDELIQPNYKTRSTATCCIANGGSWAIDAKIYGDLPTLVVDTRQPRMEA